MHNVAKYYRLTMDTHRNSGITLHQKDCSSLDFKPSQKGLYYINLPKGPDMWSMVTTVADQSNKYTNQMITRAKAACRLQNIMMRPSKRTLLDTVITHFRDCPIQRSDIHVAEDIFGPNLGCLKGKTVTRPGNSVRMDADPVPPDILKVHQSVVIAVDIMFVNKIPFW